MEEFDDIDDVDNYPGYRDPNDIGTQELSSALCSLKMLGDDVYLRMQANNLAVVDSFITNLEYDVLKTYFREDRTPIDKAMFLSAQSQMWIFAAYELMRTWRQRAKEVVKLHSSGGLALKAEALERPETFVHYGRQARAEMLRKIIAEPSIVSFIKDELRHTHIAFARMEFIRVILAKHEVSGKEKSIAYAPGYGRINQYCGSLEYQMSTGPVILGNISRRDIADEIRALSDRSRIPSEQELNEFDTSMNPPADPFSQK